MRFSHLALCLLAGLALGGCTSSSLWSSVSSVRTSGETTGSVPRVPTPSVAVGDAAAAPVQTTQTVTQVTPVTEVAYAASIARPNPMPTPRVYSQRFRDAKPVDFGSRNPQRHAVHGVDVSHWQGRIDWQTLRRQGANFAFIKATEGGEHLDSRFQENWDGAAAAGIKRGAYHFYFWCRPAREQAEWFIRNVPRTQNALPPVLDVEWNDHSRKCPTRPARAQVLSEMKIFMDILERHYGQRPIIYVTVDFYRDNLRGQFTDYPFWLRSVAAHPEAVYPDREWVFWQYSGTGLSQGLNERIDLNVFRGSERDWHAWLARAVHPGT